MLSRSSLFRLTPTLLLSISCGGGGGGSGGSSTVSGQFVDSQVEGLRFEATTADGVTSGTTDQKGGFSVPAGSEVSFFLGDIALGSATAAELLTPVSLVPGAGNENHPTVNNIARLLQSLDANGFPLDGIEISAAVRAAATGLALDVAQTPTNFAADPAIATLLGAAGASGLVSSTQAAGHLAIALLGSFGGLYEGSFSGGDSGTFRVVIDRTGVILGAAAAVSDPGEVIGVAGSLTSSGAGVFGNATSGATFTGQVSSSTLSGTWENTFFGESGTYTGTVNAATEGFVDDLLPFVKAYSGTFELAGDSSSFTFSLDARGHVSVNVVGGEEAVALVESVQGSTARVVGITAEGTVLSGSISQSGAVSGTLSNAFFGESGTFSGSAIVQ